MGCSVGTHKHQMLEVPKTAACVPPLLRRLKTTANKHNKLTLNLSSLSSSASAAGNGSQGNIPLPQIQINDENLSPNLISLQATQSSAISIDSQESNNTTFQSQPHFNTSSASTNHSPNVFFGSPTVPNNNNTKLTTLDNLQQQTKENKETVSAVTNRDSEFVDSSDSRLQFKPMIQSRSLHKEHLSVQAALRRKRRYYSVTTECDLNNDDENSQSTTTPAEEKSLPVPASPLREIPSPLPGNLPVTAISGVGSAFGGSKTLLPVRVMEGLYLGSAQHAARENVLIKLGITAILNVSRRVPNYFPKSFLYQRLELEDSVGTCLSAEVFELCNRFIDSIIFSGGKVLIHCQEGISRSPAICLAYLMCSKQMRLDTAFDFLLSKRKVINPNLSFMCQLAEYEQILFPSRNLTADDYYSTFAQVNKGGRGPRDQMRSCGMEWFMWHKCLTAPPYVIKRQNENALDECKEGVTKSPIEKKRQRRENVTPEVFVF